MKKVGSEGGTPTRNEPEKAMPSALTQPVRFGNLGHVARARVVESVEDERTRVDHEDRRALDRFLRTRASRDFRVLHDRLLSTVHQAAAGALAGDPQKRGRELLADLIQDAFLHLVADDARVLRAYEPSRGRLRPFVKRIALNRARDRLRSPHLGEAVDGTIEIEEHHASASEEPSLEDRDLLQKLVAHLVQTLPGGRPLALAAMLRDERPQAVAERTGLSSAYVNRCFSDVRRHARRWREAQERDG